jgi:hypothetical protein
MKSRLQRYCKISIKLKNTKKFAFLSVRNLSKSSKKVLVYAQSFSYFTLPNSMALQVISISSK